MSAKMRLLCLLFFDLGKALAAINRTVAGRLKGNLRFLTALRAYTDEHLALAAGGVLAGVAASLASLGLVFKSLGRIKFLLTGGEYKFSAAFFSN